MSTGGGFYMIQRRRGRAVAVASQIVTGSLSFPGGASGPNSGTVRILRTGGVPADIGAAEYTIDGFIKLSTSTADNTQTAPISGSNYSGTDGNILLDGDSFGDGRGFILGTDAQGTDRMLYQSINNGGSPNFQTQVGATNLRTGAWLHFYGYRSASDGLMRIGVNGNREDSRTGPTGDISWGTGTGVAQYDWLCKEKLEATFGCTCQLGGHLRFSTIERFPGATYTVPSVPPTVDGDTAWLCYFDDQSGTQLSDEANANHGELLGSPLPTWSSDTPYA